MTATPGDLYERDFYAWTQAQARELRRFAATRPNVPLDLPHLAEEIADLGKSERDSLRSWTARIIQHLLLLEHSRSPDPRRGWIREIADFRDDIEGRLTKRLRNDLRSQLPKLYDRARRTTAKKLGTYDEEAAAVDLPERCPYTLQQVIGDWWPDEPSQ